MTAPVNEFLEAFLAEARELVQSATDDLLALEGAPGDAEAVNRAFRAFHTLKGSVGLFDYPPWFALLHAAEDGLSAARAGTLAVDAALVDLSLETLDATARWTDAVEAAGRLPGTAEAEAAVLADRYRALLEGASTGPPADDAAAPDWVGRLLGSPGTTLPAATLTAVRYLPRADCFFAGDDPLGLVRKVPGLVALSVGPAGPWPPAEEFDPYACNLDLRLLSDAPRADVEAVFRLVSDQVTVTGIAHAAEVPAAGVRTGEQDPLVTAILAEQIVILASPGDAGTAAGRSEACARAAANALRSAGLPRDAGRCEEAVAGGARAVLAVIEAILAGGSAPSATDGAGPGPDAPEPREGAPVPDAGRTLRVEAARVDALVSLAGELVVARNALGHVAARADAGEDAGTLARAVREADATIGRIAATLHRSAVSLRLMPVSQVFRRFARPVREAARDLGKEVELDLRGEDTEADKAIVENLFEPLLHVVRNAVDHGLEDPATRRGAGKPAAGRVRIEAGQDGDGIVVSVSDDGRGIDPAFIRRRAVERGLRSAEAVAAMDDGAVTDLVFEPGFSTAEVVGALSGRGVGMDAVRAAAGRMGGTVSVLSRAGQGTTVSLRLPRTVALARLMVVEVGGEPYGIAMEAVSEIVRRPRAAIYAVASGTATVLRGRTTPVVSLARLLAAAGADAASRTEVEALLVVVQAGDDTVALEVDRLGERLDAVVRPPAGLVGTVPGVAGTTTLGDGRVLLVLDPTAMLADANRGDAR